MTFQQRCWAIIPAAGSGSRMGLEQPKQYLKLHNRYVLDYSVHLFSCCEKISGTVVVLAKDDPYWESSEMAGYPRVMTGPGGEERYNSVLNGLQVLQKMAEPDDWVLVHDAARPCLSANDLNKMLDELGNHPVGGILAVPVRDTMKRSDQDNLISVTVDRKGLWHALTPQMFRFKLLESAMKNAITNKVLVTDEAQAVELYGKQPVLIEGSPDNIKITCESDLKLAEFYLTR